ncbi:MAG: alpha-1,4-glucan--maltose-1-phosphate maltosyltransferase [Parvibaculaceae bacterium]
MLDKPSRPRTSAKAKSARPAEIPQKLLMLAEARIAIEGISTEIDGGRFAAKASTDSPFIVEADIFGDGHDRVAAALLYRRKGETEWQETPFRPLVNDRWQASAVLDHIGFWEYRIAAWRDVHATWREDTAKKSDAGQPIGLELTEAEALMAQAARDGTRGTRQDRAALDTLLSRLSETRDEGKRYRLLRSPETASLLGRTGIRVNETLYPRTLEVWVDRPLAVFGAWYELVPRSQSGDIQRHGTFDDVIARLPYVRDMGFDVLYFPPIHPIGRTNRKGRNNSLKSVPGDPGSLYAIGSEEGGHDTIHSELGTFKDFARLIAAAREHGLEIALDFAIQCSPDHPWVKEHREWFDWRPDGTIKFAENPPKKYEDIVNVHFYRGALPSIWTALRDIVLFWIEKGVRIFRVDNPHTKPFPFWEWMIGEVREKHPDVIFLSEAFTRPKPMKRLAKLGFTQSYTYFTWRNTKRELTEYGIELTQSDAREYMRPNFFPNTPDINPIYLQTSGRAGFRARFVLAATMVGNYGIYSGFELCESKFIPGKEEYLDSEKYELRAWDWDRPGHIREDIALLNRLRRERPALKSFRSLAFYNAWNDNILYYGKKTADLSDFVLVAVNLDPRTPQGAHFEVPLWEFGLPDHASIDAEDLVTGRRFQWHGKVNHMWLDPQERPYAIWRLIGPKATP